MKPKLKPKQAKPVKGWCVKTRLGKIEPESFERTKRAADMWCYVAHGDTLIRVEIREL